MKESMIESRISNENDYGQLGNIRESHIVLHEVKENREYIAMREKELETIKKVSGQVLSITQAISADVKQQGEQISKIKFINNSI